MRQSQEFLNRNPYSVYESQLRTDRANILFQRTHSYPKPRNSVEEAIREYKEVLTSEYKDEDAYLESLQELSRIYRLKLKDEKISDIFSSAEREYRKRFKNGFVDLSRNGVNDFLKERGIKLE